MKADKIIELGLQLGCKKENIEFGLKDSPKETEKAILEAAKFMKLK